MIIKTIEGFLMRKKTDNEIKVNKYISSLNNTLLINKINK